MDEGFSRQDIRKKVDILFENVKEYRTSEYFKKLLEFCARFKMLAPYNAMLVQFQMPKAEYVLTASEWRDLYHREINANARPLVVLFPFGPVNFVFEISQTHPIPGIHKYTYKEILEQLEHPYKTDGKLDNQYFQNLKNNLRIHSISLNPQLFAGSSLGAKLELISRPYESIFIDININKNLKYIIDWKADYMISTNKAGKDGQTFASIVHELGHLFCRHIPAPESWEKKKGNKVVPAWNVRNISHEAKEFEAEVVSWLICNRLEINTPSEKYLSYFVNDEYPEGVSIDHIFNSFNKIWEMCLISNLPYNSGMLYTYNKKFEEVVTKTIQRHK